MPGVAAELIRCLSSAEQAKDVPLEFLPERRNTDALLMCDPAYFEVKDVKNAFMDGNLASVDRERAKQQWQQLKETFERLGRPVQVIDAQPGLEDMVFSANQILVGESPDCKPYVVLSNMRHPSRQKEVPFYRSWFEAKGYRIIEFPQPGGKQICLEGHGDAIWHPGRQLMWGGYGHRTEPEAYEILSRLLRVPVAMLELVHPSFYHLDTAFCVLDSDSVLVYAGAFSKKGLALIRHYFKNVFEVSEVEANNFACNALCFDGKVIIEKDNPEICSRLKEAGFEVVEVDSGEFKKSGGSVFCMKSEIYL